MQASLMPEMGGTLILPRVWQEFYQLSQYVAGGAARFA